MSNSNQQEWDNLYLKHHLAKSSSYVLCHSCIKLDNINTNKITTCYFSYSCCKNIYIPCEKKWLVKAIFDIDNNTPICSDIENWSWKLPIDPNYLKLLAQMNLHEILWVHPPVRFGGGKQLRHLSTLWYINHQRIDS